MATQKKDGVSRFNELVSELKFDPMEELFRVAMDLDEDGTTRLSALKEVASYGYSKPKTTELTLKGDPDNPFKSTHNVDIRNLNDQEIKTLITLIGKAKTKDE